MGGLVRPEDRDQIYIQIDNPSVQSLSSLPTDVADIRGLLCRPSHSIS